MWAWSMDSRCVYNLHKLKISNILENFAFVVWTSLPQEVIACIFLCFSLLICSSNIFILFLGDWRTFYLKLLKEKTSLHTPIFLLNLGTKPCCSDCLRYWGTFYWRCCKDDSVWRLWCYGGRWHWIQYWCFIYSRILQVSIRPSKTDSYFSMIILWLFGIIFMIIRIPIEISGFSWILHFGKKTWY